MADEIKVTIKASLENGSLKDSFNPGQLSIDQAASGAHCPVIDVGTSEEVISFGDVGSNQGVTIFANLDATNYVDIGPESAGAMVPLIRLKAGEQAVMRLKPGITVRAQANTASVQLQMKAWRN